MQTMADLSQMAQAGAQPMPQDQAPQQGGMMSMQQQNGLVLAKQLAANPTPEMAAQIVAQLKASGNPDAEKFEQILQQTGGDPQKIKQIADAMVAQLSGGA